MDRVVWVRCPGCNGRFASEPGDPRHTKKDKLRCPYCNREFVPAESPRASE